MVFWFQLPTYWQKKDEEEKKLPMQSKVPMQSKIPTQSKIPSKSITPTPSVMTSNKADIIPRQPMMSYNIEGTIMPWVSDKTATNLQKYAKANSKSATEEKILLDEMYQEAVKVQQRKLYEKDRSEMKADMWYKAYNATDPEEKKRLTTAVQLANLSDILREWAKKEWFDAYNMNDKDLIASYWEANPDKQQMIVDYLNKDISSMEVARQIWAIEEEEPVVEEWNVIQNIWEWLASYAWGIPKVVAETGLLDRLAETTKEAINEGRWWLLGDLLLKIANSPEWMAYKEQNPEWAFSEFAAGSQVWWDPESKVAKWVETGATIAEVASAVPAIIKWGTKLLAKNAAKRAAKGKWVLKEIIAEPETTKIVQKALKEWRLEEWARGWIKRMLVWEKWATIKTTKQIDDAADLIVNNIKKPSTKPTQLYKQIMWYVSDKAKTLSNKLKKIDISKGWNKAEIKLNLKELAENTDEFIKSDIKKIKDFSAKINKATNLDELWTIRKKFDDIFSESVKNATDISAPWTRRANKLWTATRNILNDSIDEIASNISDSWTKKIFKELSAMYRAADNIVAKAGIKMLKPTKWIITKWNLIKAWVSAVWLKVLWSKLWQ